MELNLTNYKTAYISFSAEIITMTTEQLIATSTSLIAQGFNQLYYLLSTPGGNVMNGLNIYNVLRGLPAKIVFHNVGNVDSMGNVVFLSGDERYACPHSTFMFHGVGFDPNPSARVEQKNAEEMLDGILTNQKRMTDILVERTAIDAAEAADLFKEARTKDSTYAAARRIVHDVRDVNMPLGSSIFSLVFQR